MKETVHGEKRIRKRIGINKKTVKKLMDKAFNDGITHAEATGELKRYMGHVYNVHSTGNNIRVYNNYLWLFQDESLITVFLLPSKHLRRKAAVIQKQLEK